MSADPTRSQALLIRRVSLGLIMREYFLLGITGFGGGLQGRFYHMAVTKHEWLNEEEFADVNASASLAPGGNASNVGIEIARRLRGVKGMILAYLCLIVPGSVVMLLAGHAYEAYSANVHVSGALRGLESAAAALILYSATKLGLKAWHWEDYVIAVAATVASFRFRVPLYLIVPVLGLACLKARGWLKR